MEISVRLLTYVVAFGFSDNNCWGHRCSGSSRFAEFLVGSRTGLGPWAAAATGLETMVFVCPFRKNATERNEETRGNDKYRKINLTEMEGMNSSIVSAV